MGIAIESRQPEYSSKSEGQDFASYRLQLGDEPRIRLRFAQEDLPILAAANYLARSMSISSAPSQQQVAAACLAHRAARAPDADPRTWSGLDRPGARHAGHPRRAGEGHRFAPVRRHGRCGRRAAQRGLYRFRRPGHVRPAAPGCRHRQPAGGRGRVPSQAQRRLAVPAGRRIGQSRLRHGRLPVHQPSVRGR